MASVATITAATIIGRALAPKMIDKISTSLRLKSHEVRSRYVSTFSNHVDTTRSRCSKVRTIFTDDKYINLKSIYTNVYLKSDERTTRDDDFLKYLMETKSNAVVSGTGGAGKTMLMRYLSILAIENIDDKIPIFVELRNLPDHNASNFTKIIFEHVADESNKDQYELFRFGLINGLFIIFFDGLDEVNSERRGQIFNSINRYKRDFPESRVVVSTRPDSDLRQWGTLELYRVCGLSIDQVKTLISKVPFEKIRKDSFLSMIDQDFYDKHQSFLSVPLLCSLMLLTFHEFQEVPSRMTVFYEQAFETLMRSHDRAKEGFFKREHECGLSPDRFRSLFSAFCYRTLALGIVSFTDSEIRDHISRASSVSEIDVDSEKYIADLASGVCVIIRDGLKLHFIHRSFQEYFAAIYLVRHKSSDVFLLYNRLISGPTSNDVMVMAHDIDKKAFEREWALPVLDKIISQIESESDISPVRAMIGFIAPEFSASLSAKIHLLSMRRTETEISSAFLEIFKVYKAERRGFLPYFVFFGENDLFWDHYILDMSSIPKPFSKAINEAKSGKVGNHGYFGPIKSAEISDETLIALGIMDQAEALHSAIKELHMAVKNRVTKREVIDILD